MTRRSSSQTIMTLVHTAVGQVEEVRASWVYGYYSRVRNGRQDFVEIYSDRLVSRHIITHTVNRQDVEVTWPPEKCARNALIYRGCKIRLHGSLHDWQSCMSVHHSYFLLRLASSTQSFDHSSSNPVPSCSHHPVPGPDEELALRRPGSSLVTGVLD